MRNATSGLGVLVAVLAVGCGGKSQTARAALCAPGQSIAVTYDEKADLPKLYGLVAHKLKLAPSQHSEEAIKRVLGGCHSIVAGIGLLRSKMGDAHAKGRKGSRATPRHAGFAVLVTGAAAGFIIETYRDRKERGAL